MKVNDKTSLSASSIELKHQQRVERNAARRGRTPSPRVKIDQIKRLDDYDAKLKKKMEEGGGQSRVHSRSPQSSSGSSLSSFESKLERKLAQQNRKKSQEYNSSVSSFDLKLQQKLAKKKGKNAGRN